MMYRTSSPRFRLSGATGAIRGFSSSLRQRLLEAGSQPLSSLRRCAAIQATIVSKSSFALARILTL